MQVAMGMQVEVGSSRAPIPASITAISTSARANAQKAAATKASKKSRSDIFRIGASAFSMQGGDRRAYSLQGLGESFAGDRSHSEPDSLSPLFEMGRGEGPRCEPPPLRAGLR